MTWNLAKTSQWRESLNEETCESLDKAFQCWKVFSYPRMTRSQRKKNRPPASPCVLVRAHGTLGVHHVATNLGDINKRKSPWLSSKIPESRPEVGRLSRWPRPQQSAPSQALDGGRLDLQTRQGPELLTRWVFLVLAWPCLSGSWWSHLF